MVRGSACRRPISTILRFDLGIHEQGILEREFEGPGGAAFVEKLLADADVMITSFRDNALKKLGLDYEAVHARHPHLVWAQMARLWGIRS